MLYAKVVLGLAVRGPFDYFVPAEFQKKIKVGVRVWVSFRNQKRVGYVVGQSQKTNIKNIKPILEVIDDSPILDKNMLLLTKELSDYYVCALGEAIETALPLALRKGKRIPIIIEEARDIPPKDKQGVILIHDLDGKARWDIYLKSIKETLDNNRQVIVLLPDIDSVLKAKDIIATNLGVVPSLLYRREPQELKEWMRIKEGKVNIIVGTRSGIFAPLNKLGLVIIDEEEDCAYKQDQVPHYHARVAAFMLTRLKNAKLILGSRSPSLETFYLAKKKKIRYIFIARRKDFPEIKIIETRISVILSKYLQDAISLALAAKGKILLFLNRKGFATLAACNTCSIVLKCPRCNINLVYHFKDNILSCHYCNFKMGAPKICPHCNSGYIRYSGWGTEKIESELARLFPPARIKNLDKEEDIKIDEADIFIATRSIIKEKDFKFDLIVVLRIDNALNRIDFRAPEETFGLLVGLLGLTKHKLIIQTHMPWHYCFKALEKKDISLFYMEELKQRKELKFPPYEHLGLVKLRGKKENRVKEVSEVLFKKLNKYNKTGDIKILSVNRAEPSKLRGNFYWQILIKSNNPKKISKFLKIYLKDFSHSGIIVTVDIDPL